MLFLNVAMRINQHTKISALIKANESSIDAIASIAKPLRKIKIPLLRKFLTPRVSIVEAASIAGCEVQDFKRVLVPLGFIWEEDEFAENTQQEVNKPEKPAWLEHAIIGKELDVRPILLGGQDPLKEILQAYHQVPSGSVFLLINSFIPYPLIPILEKKGAQCFVEEMETRENPVYHCFFLKEEPVQELAEPISFIAIHELEEILENYPSEKILFLDVRGLPMPQPMEQILMKLNDLQKAEILYVQHHKVPLYLMEELEKERYTMRIAEVGEGDVRILFYLK